MGPPQNCGDAQISRNTQRALRVRVANRRGLDGMTEHLDPVDPDEPDDEPPPDIDLCPCKCKRFLDLLRCRPCIWRCCPKDESDLEEGDLRGIMAAQDEERRRQFDVIGRQNALQHALHVFSASGLLGSAVLVLNQTSGCSSLHLLFVLVFLGSVGFSWIVVVLSQWNGIQVRKLANARLFGTTPVPPRYPRLKFCMQVGGRQLFHVSRVAQ